MRVLCLGDPKVATDSFGPVVGSLLTRDILGRIDVVGTLQVPATAEDLLPKLDWLCKAGEGELKVLVDTCESNMPYTAAPSLVCGFEDDFNLPKVHDLVVEILKQRIDRTVFLHVPPMKIYERAVIRAHAEEAKATIWRWRNEEGGKVARLARRARS